MHFILFNKNGKKGMFHSNPMWLKNMGIYRAQLLKTKRTGKQTGTETATRNESWATSAVTEKNRTIGTRPKTHFISTVSLPHSHFIDEI